MNNKQLLSAFKGQSSNAQLWGAASQQQLERLEGAVRGGFEQVNRRSWYAAVTAVTLLWATAGSTLVGLNRDLAPSLAGVGVLALATLGIGGMAKVIAYVALSINLRGLNWSLQPLSQHPDFCQQALLALAIPSVQQFRDTAVARGRELRVGDYQCISKLAHDRADELLKAHGREVCQQVHGLSGPEAA